MLRDFRSSLRAVALGVAFVLAAAVVARSAPTDDRRIALVIGNGAYATAPKLDNAVFDARAVADSFRRLGFMVIDGYDLTIEGMRAKVSEFSASLPGAKSAVVYYAGHGVAMDDENYLIPTDIALKGPTDLDLGALEVSLLLKQMKREERVNIVILDACRDNPFAATLAKAKTRALVVERGLSRIDGDLARGTLIAFASDPKSVALDGGRGEHSPFTAAFLDHVFDPVSIDTVMTRVRAEVWEKTHQAQLPWVNTSLIGDYTLNPQIARPAEAAEPQAAAIPVSDAPSSGDAMLWQSAQHSNLATDYQAYLDAFPAGMFAQMARNRIASLKGSEAIASRAPDSLAPADDGWKRETASLETEKALALTPADEKEIQQRLTALGFYKRPATGKLDDGTRQSLTDWQKARGVAPSAWLAPLQLAELRSESEADYQKALAATVAPPSAPAVRQVVKPVPVRAVKAQPAAKPAARVAKRRAPSQAAADAEYAAPPPAPYPYAGATSWRRRTGLPGRWDPAYAPPSAGFWGGAAAGAAAGVLLQQMR